MLEIILTSIAVWAAYNWAKGAGRRAFQWAALTGIIFFGTLIVFSVVITTGVLIVSGLMGWNQDMNGWQFILVRRISMVACLVLLLAVFNFKDKRVKTRTEDLAGPPPPPTFDKNI